MARKGYPVASAEPFQFPFEIGRGADGGLNRDLARSDHAGACREEYIFLDFRRKARCRKQPALIIRAVMNMVSPSSRITQIVG